MSLVARNTYEPFDIMTTDEYGKPARVLGLRMPDARMLTDIALVQAVHRAALNNLRRRAEQLTGPRWTTYRAAPNQGECRSEQRLRTFEHRTSTSAAVCSADER